MYKTVSHLTEHWGPQSVLPYCHPVLFTVSYLCDFIEIAFLKIGFLKRNTPLRGTLSVKLIANVISSDVYKSLLLCYKCI